LSQLSAPAEQNFANKGPGIATPASWMAFYIGRLTNIINRN
jgi:hypothetical protein